MHQRCPAFVTRITAADCVATCCRQPPSTSNLKRSAFYCKACSVAKESRSHDSQARALDPRSRRATGEFSHSSRSPCRSSPGPAQRGAQDAESTRRMCARPSGCGFRSILSDAVSLNFDVKVAKDLLLWWNSTSAFATATEPAAATEDTTTDHELRFIPWRKEDTSSPLQPWEVIPVTRLQARRLTSTPAHLWQNSCSPRRGTDRPMFDRPNVDRTLRRTRAVPWSDFVSAQTTAGDRLGGNTHNVQRKGCREGGIGSDQVTRHGR